MSIAYIVDGSTELPSTIKSNKDVYVLPFKAYDEKGVLINLRDSKKINEIQNMSKDQGKNIIEPTPGMYRDLYNQLKGNGYDYIIAIPQEINKSSSFFNAEYAKRTAEFTGIVINALDVELKPLEILTELISDNHIEEEVSNHTIDLDYFMNLIMSSINAFKLVVSK